MPPKKQFGGECGGWGNVQRCHSQAQPLILHCCKLGEFRCEAGAFQAHLSWATLEELSNKKQEPTPSWCQEFHHNKQAVSLPTYMRCSSSTQQLVAGGMSSNRPGVPGCGTFGGGRYFCSEKAKFSFLIEVLQSCACLTSRRTPGAIWFASITRSSAAKRLFFWELQFRSLPRNWYHCCIFNLEI